MLKLNGHRLLLLLPDPRVKHNVSARLLRVVAFVVFSQVPTTSEVDSLITGGASPVATPAEIKAVYEKAGYVDE